MNSGSIAYSSTACRKHRCAVSTVRAAAAFVNSSSSTRWTNEPLVVCGLGDSGSRSMLANRKAIGHDVNASTRLGERLVGTGYMPPS